MFRFGWMLRVVALLMLVGAGAACSSNSTPPQVQAPVGAETAAQSNNSSEEDTSSSAGSTPSAAQEALVPTETPTAAPTSTAVSTPMPTPVDPMTITAARARAYPGSQVKIEQMLAPGANYKRYIASYMSEGLKIYGLLTVPNGTKPDTGFPVIIFNHGYIPPQIYRTTERYVDYVDRIARAGYIVFKSDYRGHGSSEGVARGGYGSPDYTTDVLNALASIKQYPDADPNRIGMWGHSMGGYITLRALVIDPEIKAASIWSGVVGSYEDMLNNWHRPENGLPRPTPSDPNFAQRNWRNQLSQKYGTPEENPDFWNSISANSYLADISAPIQLHASVSDPEVPYIFSQHLDQALTALDSNVEFYTYQGDNHNLSNSFNVAMDRTIAFFDKYVKGDGS